MKLEGRTLQKVIQILTDYPDDFSRAAKAINWSRSDLKIALEDPSCGYTDTTDEYLDSLTSAYKNWVKGNSPNEDFNGAHALKILERERPEIWAAKVDERGKASESNKPKTVKRLLPDIKDIAFNKPLPISSFEITEEDLNNLGSPPEPQVSFMDMDLEIEEL